MGDFIVFEHPGTILSRFTPVTEMFDLIRKAIDTHEILVLVNHYWEFFYDFSIIDPEMKKIWDKIVDYLLTRPDVEITTFKSLHRKLVESS